MTTQLPVLPAMLRNGGTCYNLSVLDKLTDPNGNLITDYSPSVRNHVVLAQSTWNAIHSGMRKVIEGKKYYEGLPVQVAGKTGTAQKSVGGSKDEDEYLVSFIGFAPADDPQIITLVVIRVPKGVYYGGTIAAPVMSEIFENILPYFVGYDGETWNDADGEEIPFEVIAWQKLPHPYQTKGD